jgi:hypothetical protein
MKPIEDFPGYYVTEEGKVYSDKRGSLKEISILINSHGYQFVWLWKNSKQNRKCVHQLVAQAYLTRKQKATVVCHNDGNKLNNHVSNLRYDTHAANVVDCSKHGNHPNRKLTDQDVIDIRWLVSMSVPYRAIASMYGIVHGTVIQIVNRKTYYWL